MPNTRSAAKQARKSITRSRQNRLAKEELRKAFRALKDALQSKDRERTEESWPAFVSVVDRLVKRGRLHPNTAARKKSRMAKVVRQLLLG